MPVAVLVRSSMAAIFASALVQRLVEGGEAHHCPLERGRERIDGPELLFQGGDPLAQYGGHGGTVTRLRRLQFAGGRLGARDEGLEAAALALDGAQHRTDLARGGAGVLALEATEESHREGSFGVMRCRNRTADTCLTSQCMCLLQCIDADSGDVFYSRKKWRSRALRLRGLMPVSAAWNGMETAGWYGSEDGCAA